MRFSITETKIRPGESYFSLNKHLDNGRVERLGSNFNSLEDAEKAIEINLHYPQVLPSSWYDAEGKKVQHLTIISPSANLGIAYPKENG